MDTSEPLGLSRKQQRAFDKASVKAAGISAKAQRQMRRLSYKYDELPASRLDRVNRRGAQLREIVQTVAAILSAAVLIQKSATELAPTVKSGWSKLRSGS